MSEIQNYYTKIKTAKPLPNPNFNLHNMKIPFRSIIVAPSGSGKTNFLTNMIGKFSRGKGTFFSATVITANKDEDLYNFLEEQGVEVKEGLRNTPDLDKFDKKKAHLVVFDDLVLTKDLDVVSKYYIRARKMNVSVVFLSQRYTPVPLMVRENVNYLFILKMGNKRSIRLMMSEFALDLDLDQLVNMYSYATKDKFNTLTIDKESSDPTKSFRRNFLEYLDPDDF